MPQLVPERTRSPWVESAVSVVLRPAELLVPAVQADLEVPPESPLLQLAELVAREETQRPDLPVLVALAEPRTQQVLPLHQLAELVALAVQATQEPVEPVVLAEALLPQELVVHWPMVVSVVTAELVVPAVMAAMAALL